MVAMGMTPKPGHKASAVTAAVASAPGFASGLGREAEAMLSALLASGFDGFKAIEQVAVAFGPEAVHDATRAWWDAFLMNGRHGEEVRDALDAIAKVSPEAANAMLNDALTDGRMREWRFGGMPGIHLAYRSWVTSLPAGMKVEGNAGLSGCVNLKALPAGFRTGSSLVLKGCSGLAALPEDLEVGQHLQLSGCDALTSLPKGLKVGGSLQLRNCLWLTDLPAGLEVGSWLELGGCANLRTIPEGLKVGHEMYCPNQKLVDMANAMRRAGRIHVAGGIAISKE
jgi:hypothetical protein